MYCNLRMSGQDLKRAKITEQKSSFPETLLIIVFQKHACFERETLAVKKIT